MTRNPDSGGRIFLADDHPAVIDGLKLLLAQDRHTICGEATCRAELLERIDASAADIALVDLALYEESGLDLLPELLARGIPALVYTMHEDVVTLRRALDCGASGYVTKREPSAVLLEAVRRVLAGERFISPRVSASAGAPGHAQAQTPGVSGQGGQGGQVIPLSEREEQILDLLRCGVSNAEIAGSLGVSVRTVETYFSRIIIKLSLDGMRALRKAASLRPRLG